MMMIVTLDKNLRVPVVCVIFNKTREEFESISEFLIEEIDVVKHTMPALLIGITDKYAYRDAATLKAAFRSATKDVIEGQLDTHVYYGYLFKVFRTIGRIETPKQFNSLLMEYKQLAKYIEANKDEIY